MAAMSAYLVGGSWGFPLFCGIRIIGELAGEVA